MSCVRWHRWDDCSFVMKLFLCYRRCPPQAAVCHDCMVLAGSTLLAHEWRAAPGREARQHLQKCRWYPQAWRLWTGRAEAPVGKTSAVLSISLALACPGILLPLLVPHELCKSWFAMAHDTLQGAHCCRIGKRVMANMWHQSCWMQMSSLHRQQIYTAWVLPCMSAPLVRHCVCAHIHSTTKQTVPSKPTHGPHAIHQVMCGMTFREAAAQIRASKLHAGP